MESEGQNYSISWSPFLVAQKLINLLFYLIRDIQCDTVKVIFEEFYEQGDLEKRAGRIPIPMMDRNRVEELPSSQVSFLNGICIPCYDLLRKIIPETEPLMDGCKANLKIWQAQCDNQKLGSKESV